MGVPYGKGFQRDPLAYICQQGSAPRHPAIFLGILAVFSPSSSLGSLSVSCTLTALPFHCSLPTLRFPPSPQAPGTSLHVLDVASSHGTHRDGEHSQEEDPAVVEGHLEEILGTGAAEPQSGQQEEQQQEEQQQQSPRPWPQLHSGHLQGAGQRAVGLVPRWGGKVLTGKVWGAVGSINTCPGSLFRRGAMGMGAQGCSPTRP